jgi:hypothetical protein
VTASIAGHGSPRPLLWLFVRQLFPAVRLYDASRPRLGDTSRGPYGNVRSAISGMCGMARGAGWATLASGRWGARSVAIGLLPHIGSTPPATSLPALRPPPDTRREPPVASTYRRRGAYLTRQPGPTCVLTFHEIEARLSRPLPPAACALRAWWSNHHSPSQAYHGWGAVGWRIASVDMVRQRVPVRKG